MPAAKHEEYLNMGDEEMVAKTVTTTENEKVDKARKVVPEKRIELLKDCSHWILASEPSADIWKSFQVPPTKMT